MRVCVGDFWEDLVLLLMEVGFWRHFSVMRGSVFELGRGASLVAIVFCGVVVCRLHVFCWW